MPRDLKFKNLVFACIFCVFSLILKGNIHYIPKKYWCVGFRGGDSLCVVAGWN